MRHAVFQHRIYCIASKIVDWVTAATTESSASIVENRGVHLDHHPHVGIRIHSSLTSGSSTSTSSHCPASRCPGWSHAHSYPGVRARARHSGVRALATATPLAVLVKCPGHYARG